MDSKDDANIAIEIWKSFRDSNYFVSNMGNVKKRYKSGKELIIKTPLNKHGYPHFSFYIKGKRTGILVHRAVVECFIENPDNKPCVDHINGDRKDSRAINLRWCTYKENNNFDIYRERRSASAKICMNREITRQRQSYSQRISMNKPDVKIKCCLSHGGKKFICIENNKIYINQHDCAKELCLNVSGINNVLNGRYSQTGNFHFKFID